MFQTPSFHIFEYISFLVQLCRYLSFKSYSKTVFKLWKMNCGVSNWQSAGGFMNWGSQLEEPGIKPLSVNCYLCHCPEINLNLYTCIFFWYLLPATGYICELCLYSQDWSVCILTLQFVAVWYFLKLLPSLVDECFLQYICWYFQF